MHTLAGDIAAPGRAIERRSRRPQAGGEKETSKVKKRTGQRPKDNPNLKQQADYGDLWVVDRGQPPRETLNRGNANIFGALKGPEEFYPCLLQAAGRAHYYSFVGISSTQFLAFVENEARMISPPVVAERVLVENPDPQRLETSPLDIIEQFVPETD
ncbi:hypothetical protein MKZ38_005215 [Zalerion maritima]|uniref:Uncharacterized protein n=1 Tax=Zalerion maritima TaxID=339359 RepID=A0AAD5WQI8_9PEZI|nr:hypothetical protein MKZ38_005215 [Zalerion maritima]